jgi:hypothetical protein
VPLFASCGAILNLAVLTSGGRGVVCMARGVVTSIAPICYISAAVIGAIVVRNITAFAVIFFGKKPARVGDHRVVVLIIPHTSGVIEINRFVHTLRNRTAVHNIQQVLGRNNLHIDLQSMFKFLQNLQVSTFSVLDVCLVIQSFHFAHQFDIPV